MSLPLNDTVQKLKQYTNSSFPILSVYLAIPQTKPFRRVSMIQRFQELINKTYTESQQKLYNDDIRYVASFLETYKKLDNKKSLILFSGGNKLFETITTPYSLPEQVMLNHSPFVEPLITALQEYKRYLIVLADRKKAKYFTLYHGELEAQGGMFSDTVPQKVKGRNRNNRIPHIEQHIHEHLNQHLEFIGHHVNDFVKDKSIAGILVGGHKTLLRRIEEHLPKHMKGKILGEFVADLHVSINDLVLQSKTVLSHINESQQFVQKKTFDLSRI